MFDRISLQEQEIKLTFSDVKAAAKVVSYIQRQMNDSMQRSQNSVGTEPVVYQNHDLGFVIIKDSFIIGLETESPPVYTWNKNELIVKVRFIQDPAVTAMNDITDVAMTDVPTQPKQLEAPGANDAG